MQKDPGGLREDGRVDTRTPSLRVHSALLLGCLSVTEKSEREQVCFLVPLQLGFSVWRTSRDLVKRANRLAEVLCWEAPFPLQQVQPCVCKLMSL